MRALDARTATCALDLEVRWGDGELLASEHLRDAVHYRLRSDAVGTGEWGFVVQRAWIDDAHVWTLFDVRDGEVVVHHLGGYRQTLRLSEQTRVQVGPLTFQLTRVAPHTEAARVALGDALSPRQHAWTFVSFALHAFALCCMALLPPKASSLSLDAMAEDARYLRYLSTPLASEPELPWTSDKSDAPASGEAGARARGEQGKAGKQDAPRSDGRLAVQGKDRTRELAKQLDTRAVAQAGMLGALAAASDALAPTSLFGPDIAVGYDAKAAMGALFGAQIGDNAGFGGLGMRGTGRAGGGDAEGTIGVGTLGTGDGARGAPGAHGWGAPRREARVPVLRSESAEVRGSLSKEAIRRTIQRRLNEVRFCYESGLSSNPELSGRLAVSFLIAPSGVVQQASIRESTLASRAVADCVAQAVRRFTFPAPEGGGYVQVTYPFSFSAD